MDPKEILKRFKQIRSKHIDSSVYNYLSERIEDIEAKDLKIIESIENDIDTAIIDVINKISEIKSDISGFADFVSQLDLEIKNNITFRIMKTMTKKYPDIFAYIALGLSQENANNASLLIHFQMLCIAIANLAGDEVAQITAAFVDMDVLEDTIEPLMPFSLN